MTKAVGTGRTKCKCFGRFMIKPRAIKLWLGHNSNNSNNRAKLKQETRKTRLHNMKLPYDKNPGVNLCHKTLPALVVGGSVWKCMCVWVCSCQTNEMCQKQRQNSRSKWRPFDLFTRNWHTHTHTLTHMEEREASGNLIFSNFHCFRSCLCLPACLFAFYDGNANNNWRKFLPVFFLFFCLFWPTENY